MVERLLLDRINLQRCGRAIAEAVKAATLIDADKTKPGLSVADVAMPRAKIAVRAPIRRRIPPARFVEVLGLLEDFQIFHSRHCFPRNPLYAANSLRAAALVHPIEKVTDASALAPHQLKIFSAVEICGFRTVKRFHAPVNVRAI